MAEADVIANYSSNAIVQRMMAAVAASGATGPLTPDMLFPYDQLHGRELLATRDHVPRLAAQPDWRVLDIGSGIGGSRAVHSGHHRSLCSFGIASSYLTPEGDTFARVSPGAGFWVLAFAFALLVTDALTRLRLRPFHRVAILVAVILAMALLLWSGLWKICPCSRNTQTAHRHSGAKRKPMWCWPLARWP
jgi:hypothetical protein